MQAHVKLPFAGMLELEYIAMSKPQDFDREALSIDHEHWASFIESVKEKEPVDIVAEFRQMSNFHCFRTRHVQQLLALLGHEYSNLRIEIVVTSLGRTIDFHGFFSIRGLFKTDLTISERVQLHQRVGSVNMFDATMAIDYYELDLAHKDDRWLVQYLVHLATTEPGENCVNETMDGLDYEMPAGWINEVPHKGVYCTFYCRETPTINKVKNSALSQHPNSICPDVDMPPGKEWVHPAKCSQIKRKMQEKFSTAEEGFAKIDRDGGGSIDRRELSVGLFQLGVWLHPTEMKTLFELVDEDDGGDVDIEEFKKFWNNY